MNATLTEQLAPGVSVAAQVLAEIRYSGGAPPPKAKLVKVTMAGPTLVTVTFCCALVVPSITVPKLSEVGARAIDCPVPFSATCCGLLGASSANVRVELRAPVFVGVQASVTR